jgi:iron only hydrogenase large subunit-like protein
MVCPTGALSEKNQTLAVKEVLGQKEKTVVVQYAPAITVSIAEAFGMSPGKDINGILNALTLTEFLEKFANKKIKLLIINGGIC